MIGVKYEVQGQEELKKKFSELGERVQRRVIINSLKKCAKPLEMKMKSLAPVSKGGVTGQRLASRNHPAGYLRASVGTIIGKGTQVPTIWVRPRFKGSWDPWYEHFPMSGTKKYKKAPNPFVDKAWEEMGSQIAAALEQDLTKNIQEQINRL